LDLRVLEVLRVGDGHHLVELSAIGALALAERQREVGERPLLEARLVEGEVGRWGPGRITARDLPTCVFGPVAPDAGGGQVLAELEGRRGRGRGVLEARRRVVDELRADLV